MRDRPTTQTYGTIVVIGGGCYGSYYVRQLGRARDAGALAWERLVVVDRDAQCRVASEGPTGVQLEISDWAAFLTRFLRERPGPGHAIVPSPLMPHLLFDWTAERLSAAGRLVRTLEPTAVDGVPWQRAGDERTRYLSFAEWMCPVNCIEPARCPHTRDARTWSMPVALRAHVDASSTGSVARSAAGSAAGSAGGSVPLDLSLTFHCTHRAFGVGMIDVAAVLAAEARLLEESARRPVRAVVGTVSHCHGAFGVLEVRAAGTDWSAGRRN